MGIFRHEKTYSMANAIKKLSQKGYEGFTAIEVAKGKWKVVAIPESQKLERQTRQKEEFHSRINGGGEYRKLAEEQPPKYGDWRANAKKYNPKEFIR